MFNKISIKLKLLLGFGLIVLLGLPVPYFNFINYQKITASFEELVNASFPRTQALLETKSIISSIRELTSNIKHIDFSHTQESYSEGGLYKYQLLAKMSELNKWQSIYERHITPNNQFLISTFTTLNYLKEQIIVLVFDIMALKEKHPDAPEISKKQQDLEFYSNKLAAFISSAIASEIHALESQQNNAAQMHKTATQATIMSSLLILAIALILILHLAKKLTQPVIDLRNSAVEISEGKLETQITISTHDEIGELAYALQKMIAGLLYANRELKLQQEQLKELSEKLVTTARKAGMADVATSVLHNIGNALNSVNVSAQLINEKITHSRLTVLPKTASIFEEHHHDMADFLTQDEKGKRLPNFIAKLAAYWQEEQKLLLQELAALNKSIVHIKDVISLQQSLSNASGMVQPVNLPNLIEDSLLIIISSIEKINITVKREFAVTETVLLDKTKVQQILINLIRNAKDALIDSANPQKLLTLKILPPENKKVKILVIDNGPGIAAENLAKIFSHGFTTKKNGHGFGLHGSAVAAQELGGSLTAQSEGLGKGAAFILELPYKIAKSQEGIV